MAMRVAVVESQSLLNQRDRSDAALGAITHLGNVRSQSLLNQRDRSDSTAERTFPLGKRGSQSLLNQRDRSDFRNQHSTLGTDKSLNRF